MIYLHLIRLEGSLLDLRAVFDDLVRVQIGLWNTADARLRSAHGVSMAGFDVLQVIASQPACRVLEIARSLSITVGGASQAVDRLEIQGLCDRRPNPDDRRSSIIELTPQGQSKTMAASRTLDEILASTLSKTLAPESLATLATTLATLRSGLT